MICACYRDEYVPYEGPDPYNSSGPNRGYVYGPSGCAGPDLAIVAGHDSDIQSGPNPEISNASAKVFKELRPFITAI